MESRITYSCVYDFLSQIGLTTVVTAIIIMIAVKISFDRAPDVTPTPATIKPTSPLEIIPIPTLIGLVLSFKNINEGIPHPTSLVAMATATITPERISTLMLTPRRSTCAPIIAKNKGANIISSLSTYSSTRFIILVLDTAIPTAKAPTIGDKPANAEIPAAPKNVAVVIPSILPLDFHNLSTWRILGTTKTAPANKAANIAIIFDIKNLILPISGAVFPVCTIVVTTDKTAIASISSTMAAPKINLASLDCILPSSVNT